MLPHGPVRRLCWGILVSNVGNGAWFTSWAVFLTRSAGLSAGEVGLGMMVAGGFGMLLATPLGHVADRLGPRETLVAMLLVQALGMAAYLAVGGFAVFLAAACLTTAMAQGSGGVRGALVIGLAGPRERLAGMAALRVFNHVGAAVGALIGGVVAGIGSRGAFSALIVFNAA